MNIRIRLTLRFTAIVATILTLFCIGVYSLSENYRREEFFSRLQSRGITTARLLVNVKEVDKTLLRIIDKNSIHALYHEKVLVFDHQDSLIYTSLDDLETNYSPELLRRIRSLGILEYEKEEIEHVGMTYQSPDGAYLVISSAFDRYGRSKLKNLRDVLLSGFLLGVLIILLAGYLFSRQALQPLTRINEEISDIGEGNLSHRVSEGNGKDEISQLGKNFNKMLKRLETAFGVQQQFVSSASHELRNPLASITGQLQMLLEKRRAPEIYEESLHSLLDDTQTLVSLTNGLLMLAQSDLDKQRLLFSVVRVDELLFTAQNELRKAQPDYHFMFEYDSLPDDESLLSVRGNEHLLKTAFLNFMDNACKFSADHTVYIRIGASSSSITIHFVNQGEGIPAEEQALIYTPFFRGKYTASTVPGHGLGLAMCLRIIQLHNGSITLHSESGKGCDFMIKLPIS
jgi:signal transduction histidine kinase